jgi:penicillin-binding protein 2A
MEKFAPYRNALIRFWRNTHITQFLLLLALVVVLFTILYFAFLASQANVQTLKEGLKQSTVIYDKDGDVATEISTNRNKGVEISELPDFVGNAVVAIEDHRFYEHNGFDIKGITRAFFKNLLAGRITGGGSTLTQQLTKNALLSPERTYKRKVEELFLALEIEKKYEKDEILQMYINQVYFGHGAWGIDQAANKYFNKSASELTISESALLAGLLQAPSARNPFQNYDAAIERRDVVLGKMKESKFITGQEYEEAIGEDIVLEEGGGSFLDRKYPSYTDAVLDEAISKYGLTQEEILTRGYRIYTEMDQNLQSSLESIYTNDGNFPRGKKDAIVQSGSVLLDPSTGGVRALVGGRGESVFRGFNRATHLKAQPGSTLKPLAVYTPALEEGYTLSSMLEDKQQAFGDYQPENYSKTYSGEVAMYVALQESLNLPAVWLLDEIGLTKGIESLNKFGIPLQQEDEHLAIALGGMNQGTSPLRLAAAYSAFANKGKRADDHLITKIEGPTGNIIAEHDKEVVQVTSKKVANEMTSMLLNVVESGTGTAAQIEGSPIAGKTGSTQLSFSGNNGTKDQWFVGYTPDLVGAIWLGYDQTDQNHYLTGSSSETVVPIFRKIMEAAIPYTNQTAFAVKSVNARMQGEQDSEVNKEAIKEKAEQLEQVIKEESSKWSQVIDKMKEDLKTVGGLVKDKLEEINQ